MDTLLFKNIGASALEVADLGVYLEASEELDLLINYRNEDIIESSDIETAMAGDGQVTLNQGSGDIILSYSQLIDYLTALTKYDTIDYAYISGKDSGTDITALELESLTDGSDVNNLHNHDTRYYTQTQLSNSNSGSVAVHWDNITNTPQFGALSWKEPVDRSNTGYGSGTVLPTSGNAIDDARMVADDGDGKPAQYVCIATSGTWSDQWVKIADVDWGAANSISVIASGNLSATNVQSAIDELQGDIDNINTTIGGMDLDYAYDNGSVIIVDNTDVDWQLTDSKSFKISSDTGNTNVLKVSATSVSDNVEINGSFDVNGGVITLDATTASNFAVTGNNLTLSTITSGNVIISSASDLLMKDQYLTSAISLSESGVTGLDAGFTATSIVGAINELLVGGGAANTLDEAYDGNGTGAGRIILADAGSVKIDATSGANAYAPLELVEQSAAPNSGLSAGQIAFVNGALYNYDGVRSKWLSVDEQHFDWADHSARGKYLRVGHALGTDVGFKIPVNATITKITARVTGGDLTKQLQIRKNGSFSSIKSFSLSSGEYTSVNDDIDIVAGDYIQMYVSGQGGPVKDPVVSVYLRFRI